MFSDFSGGIERDTYQGVRNVRFWKIWRALLSCYLRFEIRPFALLPTNYRSLSIVNEPTES